MYSVILATVLATAGAEGQQWHRGSVYVGCPGCYGGATYGIHHGGWGYGCAGCHGCFGGYSQVAPGSPNYSGSGHPYPGSGFASGGYTYYGGSPNGCYAPYGWYNGWRPYQDVGCFQCHGCYGYYTGWGCAGDFVPGQGVVHGGHAPTPPAAPTTPTPPTPLPPPTPEPKKDDIKKEEGFNNIDSTKALVVVSLPADAKLYIDGNTTKSTSDRRVFVTPTLIPGKSYFYELTAEVIRDGKLVTKTQKVVIRAGQQFSTSFESMMETTEPALSQLVK